MFYCARTEHPSEEQAQAEAKRLSETILSEYDRLIEHEAYVCTTDHYGKWHVRIKNVPLAREARQAKINFLKQHGNSRSHFKNNGMEKKGYNSMREAEDNANMLEVKDGQPKRAYQCAECHLWHVGNFTHDAPEMVNAERLATTQAEMGYSVTSDAPMRPVTPPMRIAAPAPVNLETPIMSAAARLQGLSHKIAAADAAIRSKFAEIEALELGVKELKREAQAVMAEMQEAFAIAC